MSLTVPELQSWFLRNFPSRDWDGLCQAFVWRAAEATGGSREDSVYSSAKKAMQASQIVSMDPDTAPAGAVHYWDYGVYGHVAVALGNGQCAMGSTRVRGWGVNAGVVDVSDYTAATGLRYRGWSHTNGRNVINLTLPSAPAGNGGGLKPFQRTVRLDLPEPIKGREGAGTQYTIRQELAPGTIADFDGFIRGQRINQNGHDTEVWLRGRYEKRYYWAGNFKETLEGLGVSGLADLGTFGGSVPAQQKAWYFKTPAAGQYWYGSLANALAGRGYNPRPLPGNVEYPVVSNPGGGPILIRVAGLGDVFVGTRRSPAPHYAR